MQAPEFWYKKESFLSWLSKPLGAVYAWFTARRFQKTAPYQAPIPVICVGNLSVGGTGKTPVCLALADLLLKKRKSFFFLNHGYKSRLKNVLVNPTFHSALDVGDEALLLAQKAPTIVDNNRARGAQLAIRNGATCLIMDDGFQNPSLIKTLSFVVVDGHLGFGNMHVLPAGPLREPVLVGLKRADAVVLVGKDTWGVRSFLAKNKIDIPVLGGAFMLSARSLRRLKEQHVLAFAGIGNPRKFFEALRLNGVLVEKTQVFPDHYQYTRFDLEWLRENAGTHLLVTTTKDAVKVPKEFQSDVVVADGVFKFEEEKQVMTLLKGVFNDG